MNKSHLTDEERLEIDRRVCDGIEKWESFVSETCIVCGEPADDKYHNALERYWIRGNACAKCNVKSEHNVRFHIGGEDEDMRHLLDAINQHSELPEKTILI